jgi:hypothetical protein
MWSLDSSRKYSTTEIEIEFLDEKHAEKRVYYIHVRPE